MEKYCILMVDDEDLSGENLSQLFGCKVLTVRTQKECLFRLYQETIGSVIIDDQTPHYLLIVKSIRKRFARLPIYIVKSTDFVTDEVKDFNIQGFIKEPYDVEDYLSVLPPLLQAA